LLNDAPEDDCAAGEQFCSENAVYPPRMLPSHQIDEIEEKRANVWRIKEPQKPRWSGLNSFPTLNQPRWSGNISPKSSGSAVATSCHCQSVCLLSNLPLIGYYYDRSGRSEGGVYYEMKVIKMAGVISIGTTCQPYPTWWRHPGWDRLSYALHLDDYRIFCGPNGGSNYEPLFSNGSEREGCTFGCGFDFKDRGIFFTYEGTRLPDAFRGIYPGVYRTNSSPNEDSMISSEGTYDVYAAIGVEGESNFEVNFGGQKFLWEEGNQPHWKVENHILGNTSPNSPPPYCSSSS